MIVFLINTITPVTSYTFQQSRDDGPKRKRLDAVLWKLAEDWRLEMPTFPAIKNKYKIYRYYAFPESSWCSSSKSIDMQAV
jgi:hypothetical protein